MTGHVCPECGVQRPGCACARAAGLAAERAAAEDFDPLRIRPYVTLDATDGPEREGPGAQGGPGGRGEPGGRNRPGGGVGPGDRSGPGDATAHLPAYVPEDATTHLPVYVPEDATAHLPAYVPEDATAHLPAYVPEDPPTTRLAAVRPGPGPVGQGPGAHPGTAPAGDPSETMPLLLRGIGRTPPTGGSGYGPGYGEEPERKPGRKRGVVVAAVAAVAVAGTAALAASLLGGAGETDDRAAVPEVTTSASLNVAVSEAPSPSSETPEPTSSSPTPRRTPPSPSATPTPSPSLTTASPSASTRPVAPPAASPTAAPTTAAPTTATPSSEPPPETEEASVTLSIGSSGEEVVELQARLTLAGAYHGEVDGEYDHEVYRAVRSYQSWMYIEGDPKGVYGPHTREVLERSTWL